MEDISNRLSPGELVCCPLCDNTIETCHISTVVAAHGLKQLVHVHCLEFDDDEDEE